MASGRERLTGAAWIPIERYEGTSTSSCNRPHRDAITERVESMRGWLSNNRQLGSSPGFGLIRTAKRRCVPKLIRKQGAAGPPAKRRTEGAGAFRPLNQAATERTEGAGAFRPLNPALQQDRLEPRALQSCGEARRTCQASSPDKRLQRAPPKSRHRKMRTILRPSLPKSRLARLHRNSHNFRFGDDPGTTQDLAISKPVKIQPEYNSRYELNRIMGCRIHRAVRSL